MKHRLVKKLKNEIKQLKKVVRSLAPSKTYTGCPMCEIYNTPIDIDAFEKSVLAKDK